jgi:hypothetical protein
MAGRALSNGNAAAGRARQLERKSLRAGVEAEAGGAGEPGEGGRKGRPGAQWSPRGGPSRTMQSWGTRGALRQAGRPALQLPLQNEAVQMCPLDSKSS